MGGKDNSASAVPRGSGMDTRLVALDALRGIAVMGILTMNIIAFALPENAYIAPGLAGAGAAKSGDTASWLTAFVLFDGKMRGLFSLLFGASLYLIAQRADRGEGHAASVHYNRMVWLGLFGALHFFLIWWGDILFLYAVIGCLAFMMKDAETKTLIVTALAVYAIGMALMCLSLAALFTIEAAAQAPDASAASIEKLRGFLAGFSDATAQQEIAVYRSDYGQILHYRLGLYWRPLSMLMQSGTETFPLMLLGMAGLRSGFISGQWAGRRYWQVVAYLLVPGLLVYAVLGYLAWRSDFDPILSLNVVAGWSMLPRLMTTLGYAALFLLLIRALAGTGLLDRLAAAGRAAFTNYLGTSILMTSIFYGYGLDLFARVSRPTLWLFVLGAWVLMLAWSKPWLDRFHYGPLEWLWRSLARRALQPMRRKTAAIQT